MIPFLSFNELITVPEYSFGTLTITFSYGSSFLPSTSLKITSGFDTDNSYPSLRIFSSKIDKCNSPRPLTLKPSAPSNSSTTNPTLVCNSFSNLSLICLEVRNLPLRPAKGEELTKKFIDRVGFSI